MMNGRLRDGSGDRLRNGNAFNRSSNSAINSSSLAVGALARDVTRLRALVAHLANGVERASVGRVAVARDVALFFN